jgi:alpha-1,3-rhamnosyl/mannosyltransferase
LDNRWYHKRKLRYVLHGANHIIAVSENTKRDLVRLFDVEPERVTVIHNGCDPIFRPCPQRVEMDAVRKSYGVEGRYLLSVSTLEPRKNLQRLLDCFLLLKEKPSNRDLILVLVGASGWKSRRLEANLEELRGKGLVFLQQVPRKVLPYLFFGAEVFVYPSLYEGFGLPVLEAMACGCPVVASRSSAIPEVIGDAGLLFDPMNVEEMAEGHRALSELARAVIQPKRDCQPAPAIAGRQPRF